MDKIEKRIIYSDVLRILAIMGVIVLHASSPIVRQFNEIEPGWWWIGNIAKGGVHWGVPIFVMVSGMLLLDPRKEESIKTFLTKRFNRLLIPFIFWGIIYSIWKYKTYIMEKGSLPVERIIESFLAGPLYYHLWFIYMILGLYFLTPIIRKYIKNSDQENIKYFLMIWFITNGVIIFIEKILDIEIGIKLTFFEGYIGYFILGYYLHTTNFNEKQNNYIYLIAFIGLLITIIGTFYLIKYNDGFYKGTYYDNLSPNVILMSTGIFIFAKNFNWDRTFEKLQTLFNRTNINDVILEVSSLSFGIYFIHALILEVLKMKFLPVQINANFINPLIGIPLTSLLTLLISVFILKFLKRYSVSRYIM